MRRVLGTSALIALGVVLIVGIFFETLVLAALRPGVPFSESPVPTAPDYESLAAWTAHPELDDESDVVPAGFETAGAEASADVFYVHPTSYLGAHWNGPIDDASLNADTDRLSTRIQATAFNGCCQVYGPRYRQANGSAFVEPSVDGDAAIAFAHADVVRAFREFRLRTAPRPFFLVAHSQGSVMATRLLAEEIGASAEREQLIAAYLIGAPLTRDETTFPVCDDASRTRCVVGWNARGPGHAGSLFELRPTAETVCVNPLSWRSDEERVGAEGNLGAVFLHASDGTPMPGFADAQCRRGTLVVREIGSPPRDLASRVLDRVLGPENHHAIEYQLFWVNLRTNARARLDAFLSARTSRLE
ncbi:MAG: DUF3089 domain-containing protein [Myxococcota bacterium]|nr:DUF3089 domain-containing protein [Myxococcota bacterium]